MRALHAFVIAVSFAILALPGVLTWRGASLGAPLAGVMEPPKLPPPSAKTFGTEELQRAWAKWFDAKLAVRSPLVRLDDSIGFYGFRETRPDKHVKVGKNDILFLDEQLWSFNRQDTPDAHAAAARFRRAQELLEAHGKALLLIVIPNKPMLFPESVPDEWIVDLPWPRPATTQIYAPFAAELDRQGVMWVDGAKRLSGLPREQIYTRTGRHLTPYAMCLLVHDGFDRARALVPDLGPIDCSYELRTDVPVEEDQYDLFRLLDVFAERPAIPIPMTLPVPEPTPPVQRPEALLIGTSFGWRVLKEARRNHAVGHTHFFYYDVTAYDADADRVVPKPQALGPEWREIVRSKSLFVVDINEENLPTAFSKFLDDLIRVLEE